MKIFTIGFTKKTAREFFNSLRRPGLRRIVDVRLNNVSQLAGFSKRDDLRFFAEALCSLDYIHLPELAPTQEMLDEYKKHGGLWENYEKRFTKLISDRRVEETVSKEIIDGSCLLCSEESPQHCHRRLVAEYFASRWGVVDIEHIA